MTDTVAQQVHVDAPWKIPPRGWWEVLKRVYGKTSANHLSLLSAAVAYYAFLSIAPLLLAVVLTYGLIGDPQLVAENVRSLITVVPREAAKLIFDQLMAIVTTTKPAVGFGLLIALAFAVYGATRASSATIEALNIIYEEKESRSIFSFYRVSLGITFSAVLVVVVGVLTASVIGFLEALTSGWGPIAIFLTKAITWIVAGMFASLIFALIYRFGPHRRKARWRWLTAGSVTATILWLLATLGVSFYVSEFGNYNETYGSLGAVVVLQLWLYVSAYVVLLGAQLNQEAERQTSADTQIDEPEAQ
ncbi:YihY/virulence factor BrkB family protein [Sphingobium naphthae]|jgi:membrane protein|uniref:YihY/virulence factor BrkB family protein n=1 Tax=Sphingobium naphthae TaxID=1886786 RepID=A0ABU3ZVF1_9SPHN|nr:YihY/virulence factor BrkB family protein [Sphingobium naphthae]MDV5823514.1 YihY/virulence factor BrkB family protein [Sphingobium naphthae]PDH63068.1 MAG: ribonuclease BN [Sphingomonadaceae bacterium MED-G03]